MKQGVKSIYEYIIANFNSGCLVGLSELKRSSQQVKS